MIRAIVVDDDKFVLEELKYQIQNQNIHVISTFTDPHEAFFNIIQEKPDVIFLDIEMKGLDGITLAIKIQELLSSIIVVFITGYPAYELEAYKTHPLSFLLKPVDESKLKLTVKMIEDNIKKINNSADYDSSISCFGRFEVLKGEKAIKFPTQKTRDLLAFLICNADSKVSQDELVRYLFGNENENGIKNLRLTLFRLRKTLDESGVKIDRLQIFSDFTVKIADGVCDFVDFIRFYANNVLIGDSNIEQALKMVNSYKGEFLSDIDETWADESKSLLELKMEELIIRIALYYMDKRMLSEIEEFLHKLIAINPISDQGYEMLLELYSKTDNVQKYNVYFKRYRNMMKTELNCFPDKKYVQLYNYYDKIDTSIGNAGKTIHTANTKQKKK